MESGCLLDPAPLAQNNLPRNSQKHKHCKSKERNPGVKRQTLRPVAGSGVALVLLILTEVRLAKHLGSAHVRGEWRLETQGPVVAGIPYPEHTVGTEFNSLRATERRRAGKAALVECVMRKIRLAEHQGRGIA